MKKLNLAIIGQGRSGRSIHGAFLLSELNPYFNVKYVVDAYAPAREYAKNAYVGCKTFESYQELFDCKDIDLVVNASYSQQHYPITKDLLLHGFNVLVEKPFARTRYECDELIELAKEKNLLLAVFQQTLLSPYYLYAKDVIASGKLGRVRQISLRANGFFRRWDWQTLQKNCAGGLYNTGPHSIGQALGFLDFDPRTRVVYSELDSLMTSGDSDDYAKLILKAPDKPLIDLEVISSDAYNDFNIRIIGSRGTFQCTAGAYKMTYYIDEENEARPLIEESLRDENATPLYCKENLIKHVEEGEIDRSRGDGRADLYEDIYYALTEGKPMRVRPEMAAQVISVISSVHANNPLPVKYI